MVIWAETIDKRTYHSPAQTGYVYIVIRHKKAVTENALQDTNIQIIWGKYSRKGSFNSAGSESGYEGVVIQLEHKKKDSVPLTVETDSRILSILQGNAPSEWNDKNWQRAIW